MRSFPSSSSSSSSSSSIPTTSTTTTSTLSAAFYRDDFSAVSFVDSLRLRASLPEIKAELELAVNALNDELLAIIDSDYALFLSLSSDLGRVDAAVSVLRAPLKHIEERVAALREAFSAPLAARRAMRRTLAEARFRRRLIEERLEAVELRESLRRDLAVVQVASSFQKTAAATEEEDEIRKTVRAAQRLAQLLFVDYPAEHLSMKHALEQRLEVALRMECATGAPSQEGEKEEDLEGKKHEERIGRVTQLLAAYACIGAFDAAQTVFRQLQASSTGDRSNRAVSDLVNSIMRSESIQILLESSIRSGMPSFEFLVKSFWSQVVPNPNDITHIEDAHKFEALRVLLNEMSLSEEPIVPSKWNFRVYCELAYEKAGSKFDSLCEAYISGTSPQNTHNSATEPIRAAIASLWEDKLLKSDNVLVTLPGVEFVRARLFRLSLRLYVRFLDWIRSKVTSSTVQIAPSPSPPPMATAPGSSSSSSPPGFVLSSTLLTDLKQLCNDLKEHRLIPLFVDTEQGQKASERAIEILVQRTQASTISPTLDRLSEKISGQCIEEITAHTKTIAAMYRRSGRAPPTAASANAGRMVKPLILEASLIDQEPEWALTIMQTVSTRFASVVEEILKREQALKNLKVKAVSEGIDDSTKIKMQLQFDAESFIADCIKLLPLEYKDTIDFEGLLLYVFRGD